MEARLKKKAADVIATVARRHRMTMEQMVGDGRSREHAWPRQEAMYEVFVQCPHLSLPQIGRAFGWRDHSTIIHGVKRYCDRTGQNYEWLRFVAGRRDRHSLTSRVAFGEAAQVYAGVMREAMNDA